LDFIRNKKIYLVTGLGMLMGLIASFGDILVIEIVVSIILIFITLLNPKIGIFILLFLQLGLTQSTYGLTKIETIFIILFSSVIIGWVLHHLIKKRIVIKRSSLDIPIIFFLIYCLFSFIKAYYNDVNIIDWFVECRVFLILVLFFVILNEFNFKKELQWLIYCFLFITTLICIKDIFLIVQRVGFENIEEVAGIQYASLYFVMGILIAVSIFLTDKNDWIRWMQIPLILLFIFRLLISLMRSYIIVFLIILLSFIITLFLFKKLRNKKIVFRMIALLVFLGIIFSVIFLIFHTEINKIIQNTSARFMLLKDFYSLKNISILSRLIETKVAWNYALNQPFLGHGFGFKYQYYRPDGRLYYIPYVHFVPLFFLLKIGFIGMLSVIWLIVRILILNWQVFKKENDLFWKILELALFLNFIGVIILSFFITNVLRVDSIFYLTLGSGIIVNLKILQDSQ